MTSKAVLITGCSTGIGRATALRLASRGWTVYASARKLAAIEDLERMGCKTLAIDVTDEESIRDAVARVTKDEGAVAVLVNNAGYGAQGPFEEVPMDEVRRQFETNVFGLTSLTQHVLPGMRAQRWGRVVNISSMGGRLTFPGGAYYHATKHAVEALSDALRFEVRGFGIAVILVEPGLVKTAFGETAVGTMGALHEDGPYAAFNAALEKQVSGAYSGPMAKLARSPETIAKVIERAIGSRHPRARYRVTPTGRAMIALRSVMPDRIFDFFLRSQFPSPGKK
ncbi:MAG: oxidoreductase [Actinomycetota bacterium]|nr:SDR family NAD(P)-dependent oxidoreductase [Actinomycetota bacterium]